MRRSYEFLLRPTRHQEIALAACLEDHRELYNAALEHRRTAYHKAGMTVKYGDQSADLKHIRAGDPDGQLTVVRDYDVIVHEALRVDNMTRRAAPKPDGEGGYLPNGGAAKSGLNRSIVDAGWGVFLRVLSHKAESAGRELIAVEPRNTSRTCARCGHCAADNRLTQAEFRCRACGHAAHADVNAAINILRAGLALRDATQAA